MKKIIFLLFILAAFTSNAQFSLRLIVNESATKKNDDIYVAGTFNNWNPKDENYKLKNSAGGRKILVIKNIASGTYAFKFTRGDFAKVESMADGRDISDRIVDVNSDVSLDFTVAGWKDDYPDKPKPYTASPQVKIIEPAFDMPQLNRKRRIWIYLPKGYSTSSKTYPVIYMQDGQNLFNEQTAAFGEWGVDEALDSLQKQLNKECIVVGIDHGGDKRMTEYNPYDNDKYGKAEGKQYVDFLANTLKPYIDSKYRTKKGPEYTFVAGSSMGAIISLYAVMQYPQVFGGAGIFSPAFWVTPQLYVDADKFTTTSTPKLFFYAGGKEDETMIANMNKMADIFIKKPRMQIRRLSNPIGMHNEKAWREEFPGFYKWLMQ